MPQKSTSPPPAPTVRKRFPLPLVICLLLVVLAIGGLAGWKIYHSREVAADKARFAQAESDVNELSKQIVATVGQPVKTQTDKYCSRPNLKLDDGPLSCDIYWYGFYEVDDEVQATTLFRGAKREFTTKWQEAKFISLDNASSESFENLNDKLLRIQTVHKLTNKMVCKEWVALYLGSSPPYENYLQSNKSKQVLVVRLNCGDKALVEHYPMKS